MDKSLKTLIKHNTQKKAFVSALKGLELVLRVANGIPLKYRDITRDQVMGASWAYLRWVIEAFNLDLQAFCLQEGYENEGETYFTLIEDAQIVFNLWLLREDEAKVNQSIETSLAQIEAQNNADPIFATWRIDRVRQRILQALAVRQLVHCMAHAENKEVVRRTDLYDQSSWSHADFKIINGKVKFTPPVLMSLLNGVEVERVRECPVCSHYFWAGRINMRCCSTPHANVLRMREYRNDKSPVR
jgi:hypothetical protein